jgi:Ser/Thr protein kinase RdoA (MazF antagonist)
VVEKYQKEAYEEQEKKLQQLRENKVPVEQPLQSLVGSNAATPAGD